MCRMVAPRSATPPGIWASTFRISSVAAIAKTPSAKASSRAGFTLDPQRAGRVDVLEAQRLELEAEDRLERGDRVRDDLLDLHRPAELTRDRGEGGVVEP